jgi:hypothetical protein
MNMPPLSTRRALSHVLVLLALLALTGLTLTGCKSKGTQARTAPPRDAAQAVAGRWTVTLNPDMVEQGVQPRTVPLVIQASALADGKSTLTGTLADAELADGSLSTGGAEPTLQFTTGTITAEEGVSAEGPLNWTGALQNGRLFGEVVGPDGRSARWMATKN